MVNADVADLQRGKHLSHLGANLAVFDLFDEGESQKGEGRGGRGACGVDKGWFQQGTT